MSDPDKKMNYRVVKSGDGHLEEMIQTRTLSLAESIVRWLHEHPCGHKLHPGATAEYQVRKLTGA